MHDLSCTLVCSRGRVAAAKSTINLLAISTSVMPQCLVMMTKARSIALCAAEQVVRSVQRRGCTSCHSAAECVLMAEVVKVGTCIYMCQLAMYRHNDIRCTAHWRLVRHCAPGSMEAPAYTTMLLLLLTILLAAGGVLADVSYNIMPQSEGQSGRSEARLRPQERSARALLVVGGRNDPEVLGAMSPQTLLSHAA